MTTYECGQALHVLVCKPYIPSVHYANSNLSMCLYRESIDPERLLKQHDNLVHVLNSQGIKTTYTEMNTG
jgi:N-dimethylarginine dimethylaminohydrolase